MTRANDYITAARAANRQVWDGIATLVTLQREWNALDYGTTLPDGTGDNAGVTKSEVGSVVFDTAAALVVVLNAGHATNMASLL